ncbi:MAG: hypothetical protein ACRD6B_07635 [Bryobacteraceae bacterium]
MRAPDEQEDFLERGRFGEGKQRVGGNTLNPLVKWALIFFGITIVCIAVPVVLSIGRDDGGPFFLQGAMLCVLLGVGFLIDAGVRALHNRRR